MSGLSSSYAQAMSACSEKPSPLTLPIVLDVAGPPHSVFVPLFATRI